MPAENPIGRIPALIMDNGIAVAVASDFLAFRLPELKAGEVLHGALAAWRQTIAQRQSFPGRDFHKG